LFDDAFDGATVSTIISYLRDTFDTTIIDCEHQLSERTLAVLDAADTILVVTQPSVPALRSTKRTLDLFQRLGYNETKIDVVLNRFQFGDVFTLATVAESLKRKVAWSLPNDYRAASGALNKGVAISTEDPASKLAQSFAQLAGHLRKTDDSHAVHSIETESSPSRLRKFFGKHRGASNVA
jgi:pilus assembly protein CpaE